MHTTQTPAQPLLGRSRLLAAIQEGLDLDGAVMVVGPPGIGKTALARALGADVWVDLVDAVTIDDVRTRLAAALSAPSESDSALTYALSSAELVVLDGGEGAAVAVEQVVEWMGPATRWVLTSRRRLDVPGAVVEVGPLSAAAGADLLRSRVRSSRRKAELDQEALQALSTALDGVPLALELAAAHLRLYEPSTLATRSVGELDDRRRPERQQLLASIQHMLDELSPDVASTLRAAAVIPGAAEVALIEVAAGHPVDHTLLELLDAALVHPEGGAPPRFRVLAPIRAAVASGIDAVQRQQIYQRLADHVLPQAEADVGSSGPEPTDRLDTVAPVLGVLIDCDDPALAYRASLALGARDHRMGAFPAIAARDERLPQAGPADLRVRWALMVADALRRIFRVADAQQVLDRVASLLDASTQPDWDMAHAICAWLQGELHQGALDRAVAAATSSSDPAAWRWVGAMQIDAGWPDKAVEALRRAAQSTHPLRRTGAMALLASALHDLHAPPPDIHAVLDQIDLAAYPAVRPQVLETRAFLAADAGRILEAEGLFEEAAEASRSFGEVDAAAMRWLMAQALRFARGVVPEQLLEPTRFAIKVDVVAACFRAWRAVVHAALGHTDAALAIGPPAVAEVLEQSPRNGQELTAVFAVALAPAAPEAAARLLDAVETQGLCERARALLDGSSLELPSSAYEHILDGIITLTRRRVKVQRDGQAFVTASGETVDISRRRVLQRVLAALAQSAHPMSVDDLCAKVWPDERMVGQSGTRRVHVAISTLRGLGLREVIDTIEATDGTRWQLTASVEGP